MKFFNMTTALALAALALPVTASAAKHEIDPAHTFVMFKVKHLNIGNAWGMFRETTGMFDAENGKLELNIKAASLFTGNKKRDQHLNSPDFFNSKAFPTITFKATKVEKKGEDYMITGDLSLKGKTNTVVLKAQKVGEGKDPWGNFRTGYEGTLTIDRNKFGLSFMPDALSAEIELIFAVEGIRK